MRDRGNALAAIVLVAALGCSGPDTPDELAPDVLLQHQLGLTEEDRVHVVRIRGGEAEVADPRLDSVQVGSYVQFTTADWFVHEVHFELDSMTAEARGFIEASGQASSPPLLERDARFVVSFVQAPPGRYPYRMEGNSRPGHGLLVVTDGGGP